jgi:hypothetical protein
MSSVCQGWIRYSHCQVKSLWVFRISEQNGAVCNTYRYINLYNV